MTLIVRPGLRRLENPWQRLLLDHQNNHQQAVAWPAANVVESATNFELQLAVPGWQKEDFEIKVENKILSISAKNESTVPAEGTQTRHREFQRKAFSRSFSLPKVVNTDLIGAKYEQGVLVVTLPKHPEAATVPARQIAIAE